MKAWWGQKCSFCPSVCSYSHSCRPHSRQPWLLPAASGCHEPVTAIQLLTSQAVPGYSPGGRPRSASLSIIFPSCWWRPETLLEILPQDTVLHSLPWSNLLFQWILEVGSLGVAMSILLSSSKWELHPSSLQEIFPGLLLLCYAIPRSPKQCVEAVFAPTIFANHGDF